MLSIMRKYLKPYTLLVLIVVALVSVQVITDLYLPTLNADIINNGIAKGNTDYIWQKGLIMLAYAALIGACALSASYFASRSSMAFGRDLRSAVFKKVMSFSQQDIDKFSTPSLITRTGNDVQQIQMAAFFIQRIVLMAPIQMVGGIILALRQDVELSWTLVVALPLMLAIVGVVLFFSLPLFMQSQTKLDRLSQVMREKLAGVRVIRAFVRTDYEKRRFDGANADQANLQRKINRIMSTMMPLMNVIFNMTMLSILYFGARRMDSAANPLELGNLTAFLSYAMQIMFSVLMAVMMFVMLPRAAASATRIKAVLDTEPSITDAPGPVSPKLDMSQGIRFDSVSFRYPGAEADVLTGIGFTALPGQTVAVIGPTGSGKSTLAALIPRFYDATGGDIYVGGVKLRDIPLSDLRGRIGLVPQKAFLFTGSVFDNLRYGSEDASDDELWAALDAAQASDFVREMPDGGKSPITQGGSNVSGGQRQRLAIARALVGSRDILVFDDSFSALDFKTDALLREALRPILKTRCALIVAQRVSTIMDADLIIVLDEGKTVGMGTHRELMESCGTYREIVISQMGRDAV